MEWFGVSTARGDISQLSAISPGGEDYTWALGSMRGEEEEEEEEEEEYGLEGWLELCFIFVGQ